MEEDLFREARNADGPQGRAAPENLSHRPRRDEAEGHEPQRDLKVA